MQVEGVRYASRKNSVTDARGTIAREVIRVFVLHDHEVICEVYNIDISIGAVDPAHGNVGTMKRIVNNLQ